MSKYVVRSCLLSFVVVFAVGLIFTRVDKSTAQSSGGSQYLMLTGNMNANQYDYLYIIDTTSKRMAVYRYYRKSLDLLDVRNIKYDLRLDFYQKYTGRSIQSVRKALKRR